MAQQTQPAVILVVEDEPFIRMLAADALAARGMTVLEADCAEEALALLDIHDRIDLLFTDVDMPGAMNGLEMAEIVTTRRPEMKLIVTSGAKQMAEWEIPDHGIFIPKPYNARYLIDVVDTKLSVSG